MCHAAIIAREYGLPAVVGTGIGTKRIRTGDRLRVDADAGVVTILSSVEESRKRVGRAPPPFFFFFFFFFLKNHRRSSSISADAQARRRSRGTAPGRQRPARRCPSGSSPPHRRVHRHTYLENVVTDLRAVGPRSIPGRVPRPPRLQVHHPSRSSPISLNDHSSASTSASSVHLDSIDQQQIIQVRPEARFCAPTLAGRIQGSPQGDPVLRGLPGPWQVSRHVEERARAAFRIRADRSCTAPEDISACGS